MNYLINIAKGLEAEECRLKKKKKTLLSTSFGFQQIICQQLVVKHSSRWGEDKNAQTNDYDRK